MGMTKFEPIVRKPGEVIRSEDWNKIQEQVSQDIKELEAKLQALKEYVDNMEQTQTLLNLTSPVGVSFPLGEVLSGEKTGYDSPTIGLITRQWLPEKGQVGVICKFGLNNKLQTIDYWSGAENGDKKTLEVTIEYIDGTSAVVSGLFVHDRSRLRPKGTENPYVEYLLSPNENVWYRYRLANPNPEKKVLSITFKNLDPACNARIGNLLHYASKITPKNMS